jgi:large subunit ribosomal protein L10
MEKFPASHNSAKKAGTVESIVDKFSRAQSAVLIDYRGLTVAEDNALRAKCREAGVEYRVLKNTMIKRACVELGIEGLDASLEGPTAVAFGYEDPIAPARVLDDFVNTSKKTQIKAGVVGKQVMGVNEVKALAGLKSRDTVIGRLLGTLNAPIRKLVLTLKLASEKESA